MTSTKRAKAHRLQTIEPMTIPTIARPEPAFVPPLFRIRRSAEMPDQSAAGPRRRPNGKTKRTPTIPNHIASVARRSLVVAGSAAWSQPRSLFTVGDLPKRRTQLGV